MAFKLMLFFKMLFQVNFKTVKYYSFFGTDNSCYSINIPYKLGECKLEAWPTEHLWYQKQFRNSNLSIYWVCNHLKFNKTRV